MRFKYAGAAYSQRAPIDMTPMLDIVFNLLLFFLLSSSFVQHTSIEVKLPKTASSTPVEGEVVVIELTSSERIFLQGKELSLQDLPSKLKELYSGSDLQRPLLIRADEHAYHGGVVALLDIAREVGVTSLNVATMQTDRKQGK